jgi:hypothetical protein
MAAISQWNYVADGGLETDRIFNHGAEMPEFAVVPLAVDGRGMRASS